MSDDAKAPAPRVVLDASALLVYLQRELGGSAPMPGAKIPRPRAESEPQPKGNFGLEWLVMAKGNFEQAAYAFHSSAGTPAAIRDRLAALLPWYRNFLAPWLPTDRATPMIDVPCGPGNLLYALRELGYSRVVGYDADAGQVKAALALGLPAEQADAFDILARQAPESVARVFSLDFIEHLEPSRAADFCRAVHRVLAAGGYFLVRTPSADGPFGAHDRFNDVTHRWAMTYEAAHALLGMTGFDPNAVQVIQEAPVPYKWQNRLRRLLFDVTTRTMGGFLELAGIGAPRIWTRSMWIVARK
jgi:SAM-dependent methyltransferase